MMQFDFSDTRCNLFALNWRHTDTQRFTAKLRMVGLRKLWEDFLFRFLCHCNRSICVRFDQGCPITTWHLINPNTDAASPVFAASLLAVLPPIDPFLALVLFLLGLRSPHVFASQPRLRNLILHACNSILRPTHFVLQLCFSVRAVSPPDDCHRQNCCRLKCWQIPKFF